jgi:hypothetical protein
MWKCKKDHIFGKMFVNENRLFPINILLKLMNKITSMNQFFQFVKFVDNKFTENGKHLNQK